MILEHLIIAALYILGASFHVMKKIASIRAKFPDLDPLTVWRTFKKEEWNTIIVAGLGWLTVQIFWFIVHYKDIPLPVWLHDWGAYLFALVMGYALQRLIYKLLGTTEKVLEKRIEKINGTS